MPQPAVFRVRIFLCRHLEFMNRIGSLHPQQVGAPLSQAMLPLVAGKLLASNIVIIHARIVQRAPHGRDHPRRPGDIVDGR